jgi:acid phosphatase
MLVHGMWRTTERVPLLIQAEAIDSLEPKYPCPAARDLLSGRLTNPNTNPRWAAHLAAAAPLYAKLDAISAVPPSDTGFHASLDHYYDNLSARQCHQKPLPCRNSSGGLGCVTQDLAEQVYRFGHWEYDHMYRGSREALAAAAASYGVWIAELAAHLRGAMMTPDGNGGVIYFHNVAHDGSVSRLLAVLQLEEMVWPGMGSEVVFELYKKKKKGRGGYFVRVLWGGQVLRSSNPSLGVMDMLPVERLLAYFDGLVGQGAKLVVGKCNGSVALV